MFLAAHFHQRELLSMYALYFHCKSRSLCDGISTSQQRLYIRLPALFSCYQTLHRIGRVTNTKGEKLLKKKVSFWSKWFWAKWFSFVYFWLPQPLAIVLQVMLDYFKRFNYVTVRYFISNQTQLFLHRSHLLTTILALEFVGLISSY